VSARRPGWRPRLVGVTAVVLGYILVWRPLRVLLAGSLAPPVFTALGAEPVVAGPHAAVLLVGSEGLQWAAPAGIMFVLGAVVLVAMRPRWRPVLAFWAAHVALGGMAALAVTVAAHGLAWGVWLHGFVEAYLVPGLTLATIALALVLRGSASGEVTDPRAELAPAGER